MIKTNNVNQFYSISQSNQTTETFIADFCKQYQLPIPSHTYEEERISTTWSEADALRFKEVFPDAIRIHSEYFNSLTEIMAPGYSFSCMTPSYIRELDRQFNYYRRNPPLKSVTIDWHRDPAQTKIRVAYEDGPRACNALNEAGYVFGFGRPTLGITTVSIIETGSVIFYGNNNQFDIKMDGAKTLVIPHNIEYPPYDPNGGGSFPDWE